MSFFTALLSGYEKAEATGSVDNHEPNEAVLLPLYHTNLKSNGKNIIRVLINRAGILQSASIVPENEKIIFPITENSVSRSSNVAAHPIVDKLEYVVGIKNDNNTNRKNTAYNEGFTNFFDYLKPGKNKEFMEAIKLFIDNDNFLLQIINSMDFDKPQLNGLLLTYLDNGKKQKIDLSNFFLTFSVENFDGLKDISVTKNYSFHREYIQYIRTKVEENGVCSITGKKGYITSKHRGLMGNAKIISVSNNKETYYGRFHDGTDIISIGYNTSEKIHLMIKYLLENENSNIWLGDSQYLINWFDDDLKNERKLNITSSFNHLFTRNEKTSVGPVSASNASIATSITSGKIKYNKNATYYIAIIDKASNGRISIKYFNQLKLSQLNTNLLKWERENSWYFFNQENKSYKNLTPSLYQFLTRAYGIERDGKITLDNSSFSKDQYVKLVECIVQGKALPNNIKKQLFENTRQRLKYKKTWSQVLNTTLAALNFQDGKEYQMTLDNENLDRSYLFGRLLAIYEIIERASFSTGQSSASEHLTNAERYWTNYTTNPADTMTILENKIKPYEKRLKANNIGLLIKLQKQKEEIIEHLESFLSSNKINKSLTYEYLFGYYNERNYIYSRNGEDDKNE